MNTFLACFNRHNFKMSKIKWGLTRRSFSKYFSKSPSQILSFVNSNLSNDFAIESPLCISVDKIKWALTWRVFLFFQAKWPLPDWNFCWFTAIRACNIVFILLKNHSLFSSILKNNKAHPLFWTMRHPLRGSIANRNRTDHLFIRANLDVFLYGVFTYIQCNYSVQPGRYWALTALIDISLQFLFILSCNRFVGIGTNWTAFFHCFY